MAPYRITIKKTFQGFPWVNSYVISAASQPVAATVAADLVAFEKAITSNQVLFTNARVSLVPDPTRTQFINIPLTGNGTVALGFAGSLSGAPVVSFFEVAPASLGMPGKKLYRFTTKAADVYADGEGFALNDSATYLARWNAAISDVFEAIDGEGASLVIGAGARTALSMAFRHMTTLQTHHGWFDKEEPAP